MEKTPSQRRGYINTVVRGQDSSTTVPMDIAEQGSGTESPQKEEAPSTRQPTRRRRSARAPGWWETNRDHVKTFGWGILGAIVAAALIGIAVTLIDLRRDVALLQQTAGQADREMQRLRDRLEEVNDRVLSGPQRKGK